MVLVGPQPPKPNPAWFSLVVPAYLPQITLGEKVKGQVGLSPQQGPRESWGTWHFKTTSSKLSQRSITFNSTSTPNTPGFLCNTFLPWMTCWERVKEGARLIPQTLPLIYIEKNSPTQRQAETLWRFSSDLTCLMQQHTHNTYIHTCTHAQVFAEPFESSCAYHDNSVLNTSACLS